MLDRLYGTRSGKASMDAFLIVTITHIGIK